MPANIRIALGLAPKANRSESDTDRENQGGMRLGNRMRRALIGSNRARLPIGEGVEADSGIRSLASLDRNATALETAPETLGACVAAL